MSHRFRFERLNAKHILCLAASLLLSPLCGFASEPPQTCAQSIPDLVEKVAPAIVSIRTTQDILPSRPMEFFGDPFEFFFRDHFPNSNKKNTPSPNEKPREQNHGVGSGFLLSDDGQIMTSAHVIEGAKSVYVTLHDRREFKATVIAADARSDVALIKINAGKTPALSIGDSDKIRVGESVLAFGSPFGLENTVTAGIISAKSREIGEYLPFIQTDVPINRGNSGGALVDMCGQSVGINSQIYSPSGAYVGISLATPINEAIRVAEQLRKHGRVIRSKIGIHMGDVSKEVAESLGLRHARGVLIRMVEPNGPADRAGIEAGDIILQFNGKNINKINDLPRAVGETKPGSIVNMHVWRRGRMHSFNITVVESDESKAAASPSPPQSRPQPGDPQSQELSWTILGIQTTDLSVEKRKKLKIEGGIEVTAVTGSASRSGMRTGDVITRVGNIDITSKKQFSEIVEKINKNLPVPLFIRRAESTLIIILHPSKS